MLDMFDEATAVMRRAMKEQIDRLLVDVESTGNKLTAELVTLEAELDACAKLREQAAERQRKAVAKFKAAQTDAQAILLSIKSQVEGGKMYTGGDTVEHQDQKALPNGDQ